MAIANALLNEVGSAGVSRDAAEIVGVPQSGSVNADVFQKAVGTASAVRGEMGNVHVYRDVVESVSVSSNAEIVSAPVGASVPRPSERDWAARDQNLNVLGQPTGKPLVERVVGR